VDERIRVVRTEARDVDEGSYVSILAPAPSASKRAASGTPHMGGADLPQPPVVDLLHIPVAQTSTTGSTGGR
jgi:hypothetical protein